MKKYCDLINIVHCVKSVRIRNFSGPYFPASGLNTERFSLSLRIQSECGKIRTRKTRLKEGISTLVNTPLSENYQLFRELGKGNQLLFSLDLKAVFQCDVVVILSEKSHKLSNWIKLFMEHVIKCAFIYRLDAIHPGMKTFMFICYSFSGDLIPQ